MSEAWASYPGAPVVGTVLCNATSLPNSGTHSISVGDFSILIVVRGDEVLGFVNACPHQYLPLDYRSHDVLSADGNRLICSNHDAVFDAETGHGIGGFGRGCELDSVPINVIGGKVVIG